MPKIPKLVNRGPAGLLKKWSPEVLSNGAAHEEQAAFLKELLIRFPDAGASKIVKSVQHLSTLIVSLKPDPNNARVHPERNLRAIMASLAEFGQLKPIVVRQENMTVMAGNGTMTAAVRLGWTHIAASIVSMTDVTAAAYGLADNRTSELATWDFKTVARLEKLIAESTQSKIIGWLDDEIAALRVIDAVESPDDFAEVDESLVTDHICPKCGYTFSGGSTQAVSNETAVAEVIAVMRRELGDEVSVSECLALVCEDWLRLKRE